MKTIEMTKNEAEFISEALSLFRNLTQQHQQEITIEFDKLLADSCHASITNVN